MNYFELILKKNDYWIQLSYDLKKELLLTLKIYVFYFFDLQREDWQEVKAQHIHHYENIQLPVPLGFLEERDPFR